MSDVEKKTIDELKKFKFKKPETAMKGRKR
jgi:hypothetical protein